MDSGASNDVLTPRSAAAGFLDAAVSATALIEAILLPVWVAGDDAVVSSTNAAWRAFTGAGDAAPAGASWLDIVHPDDVDRCDHLVREHARSGWPYEIEVRLRRADGRYRWMCIRASRPALADAAGAPWFSWVGTCTDIDDEKAASIERRRSDAARKVSDARLRRLFDANIIGIVISNNAGAILEANDAFLEMIGYPRADLDDGRIDWRRLTPPDWIARDEEAIREMAANGVFQPFEKEYLRSDGTRLPISVGGARIPGTADEQICYIADLTRVREAEEALRLSELRYRASEIRNRGIIEASPCIIMLTDETRTPVYVNPQYEAYTGIPSAELRERWAEPLHPDDLPRVRAARATGEPYEVEYRLRRGSDGAYRWHLARAMPIDDSEQPVWLATAMDIDDRKRAEETLRFIEYAGARLSESLDLQTTFETLLDLVVPAFGDWASITVREDDEITTVVARHKDPAKAHLTRQICGLRYFRAGHAWGTVNVYATGQPQIVGAVTAADLAEAVEEPYLAIFEELGYGSLIALPIFSGDTVIGSFGIVTAGNERSYTPADLPPLQELARRAGTAIVNARRFEREHRVADVLQAAALPQKLPAVPGFAFDGYYQAGRQEALIGGDWYDVLVVQDGRIVVSVGDVAGSGLEAAVLMSTVRQLIRGAASVHADPILIFDVVDRALRSEHEHTMVTAFVGVIDPRHRTMLYASAGHPPALVRTDDGTVVELDTPGLPLGCRGLAPSESRTAILPAGASLLLYTDGLVEWSRDIVSGLGLLRRRFAEHAPPGSRPSAQSLVANVLPSGGAVDDVAVLIVRIDSSPSL